MPRCWSVAPKGAFGDHKPAQDVADWLWSNFAAQDGAPASSLQRKGSAHSFLQRDTRIVGSERTKQVTTRSALHVLCVDDDVHVLALLSDTLAAEGYDVQTALDGADALQKIALSERPYDVMIVDARMPNLDGCRFIMQARAGGYDRKIIVFSAHLDEDEVERYQGLKVDRLIEKPPGRGELVRVVRELADEM